MYVRIRRPDLQELNACFHLDSRFETQYVWQMEPQQTEDNFSVTFRRARLPRPVRMHCPDIEDTVFHHYRERQCVLAALSSDEKQVVGFIDLATKPWESFAWLHHIVVAPEWRRQGIGAQLLKRGVGWAKEQDVTRIFAAVPTKAYPLIRFLQKYNFYMSGYHDDHFSNGDIAIFLTALLR